MSKITTGQMFEQWELMNQKLEALDNKINGIIDGSTPANTQLTGSIVEDVASFINISMSPGSTAYITSPIEMKEYRNFSVKGRSGSRHNWGIRVDYSQVPNTFGESMGSIHAAEGEVDRHLSDLLPALGEKIRIALTNNSSVSQSYDVVLTGVK